MRGRLVSPTGEMIAPCTVLDISAGGARVEFKKSVDLPVKLTLAISWNGQMNRYAEVRWQDGAKAGLIFVKP